MQKGSIALAMALLLAAVANAQQCVQPVDGEIIQQDTLLCQGSYTLPQGLTVPQNIVLDCQGSTLRGDGLGNGIWVTGDNAQVRNCFITNYAVGLKVENVQGFVESALTFASNQQDRSIVAGEDVTLPPVPPQTAANQTSAPPTAPGQTPAPVPPVAPVQNATPTMAPPVPPVQRNASIWLVADVKSEELLRNAMSYEYASGNVPEAVLAQRIAELQQTLQDVTIQREFVYSNGVTKVRITIRPESGFFRRVVYENITLYEYIPKCFAQLVDDVVFEGSQPVVLEQDPLLKKVIPRGAQMQFAYSHPGTVSKECQELFRVVGIGMGRKVNTLSSVIAEKGVGEVFAQFPFESASVCIFLGLLIVGGVWYKRQAHGIRE